VAVGPPPNPASEAVGQPPPPTGPGQAAVLIPANPANPSTTPPGVANPGVAGDSGKPRGSVERTLPPGFKAKREAGYHVESGWPLVIVGERDGGNMILIPGATFTMGSDSGESEDGPAHTVRLSTYYIDQYEVTNRQFRTFLEATHYVGRPPGKWLTDEKLHSQPDTAPAVSLSYNDAEAYAMWALKRLPTEAQWELAARSVDGRRYPWGHQPVRSSRTRPLHQVEPVMSFPEDVSPYGVFDMAGNAMEWVRDWYDPRYYDKLRDKTTEDPTGPPIKRHGIDRVVKGGTKDGTVFSRQGIELDRRLPYLGFRCSLAVEGGEASAIITPHPAKPAAPQPGGNIPEGQAGGGVPY
jgi:formylglycine-generating enzyme